MKNKKELELKKLTISKLTNEQKVMIKGGDGNIIFDTISGVGQLSDVSDPTMVIG